MAVVAVVVALGWTGGSGTADAIGTCPMAYQSPLRVSPDLRALAIEPGSAYVTIDDSVERLEATGAEVNVVPDPPEGVEAWVERFFFAVDDAVTPGATGVGVGYQVWVCLGGKVPEIRGETVGAAGVLLEASGLGIADDDDPSWEVVGLDQAVGSIVPFGTVVTVSAAPPESDLRPPEPGGGAGPVAPGGSPGEQGAGAESGSSTPEDGSTDGTALQPGSAEDDVTGTSGLATARPWLLGALLVILAGLAGTGLLRRRGRRARRAPHVSTRVRDDLPTTEVTELPGIHAAHTVDVRTHRDEAHLTLGTMPPSPRRAPEDADEDQRR